MDVFWGFHENGSSAATAFFPGGATGEQALITARSMAIRECQVSFIDQRGVRHSVAVYASTVLEAAAAGLKQIRETEMIGDDGVEDLTVDIKTTTSHKVPLFKLKAWLESSGRDPREAALKSKLR